MNITDEILMLCDEYDVSNSDYYEVVVGYIDTDSNYISVKCKDIICLGKKNMILRYGKDFFFLKDARLGRKVADTYSIYFNKIYCRVS